MTPGFGLVAVERVTEMDRGPVAVLADRVEHSGRGDLTGVDHLSGFERRIGPGDGFRNIAHGRVDMSRDFLWGPSPDDRSHGAAQLGDCFRLRTTDLKRGFQVACYLLVALTVG